MKLDTSKWKAFLLSDLFDVKKGKRLTSEDQTDGNTLYIGAIDSNNGVANHIGQDPIHSGNTISLSYNGSVGEAFYQPVPFWATDDVNVLYFKSENNHEFNQYIGLFICAILRMEKYRFSYGRKWTLDNMCKTVIRLPATPDGTPDWQSMESYMKSLHHKPLTTKNKLGNAPELETEKWGKFKVGELFELRGGYYNKKPEHSADGMIPFLGSTENNNGVTEYYSIQDIEQWDKVGNEDWSLKNKLYDGNCIAVTVNGSVCNAFYQNKPFTCSHDITSLCLKNYTLNEYIALFLCAVIMKEKYRWSYGRKPHDIKKLGNMVVRLPITSDSTPDWEFMEEYIKSLPYGDRL